MPASFNLSLTDELKEFVETHSGDGTLFASSSEYIRALIREKKEREDAAKFRESVLAGLQDVIDGRTIEYKGSIEDVIRHAKELIEAAS